MLRAATAMPWRTRDLTKLTDDLVLLFLDNDLHFLKTTPVAFV
jgi:hypothetical protein